MKNRLIIFVIIIIAVAGAFYFISSVNSVNEEKDLYLSVNVVNEEENPYVSLVNCLAEKDVIVFSTYTCPFCINFADQFGGFEIIMPIYVDCADNPERCAQEMQTNYVPEIQINGVLYDGPRTPEALAEFTGCKI